MPKKKSERLHRVAAREPRGGAHRLLDLAWDLDTSTPEEAWSHPWRSGVAAARLAASVAKAGDAHLPQAAREVAIVLGVLGVGLGSYEEIQRLRFELQVGTLGAREARWLRAGCLIVEAMLAHSGAGGHLYGQLLWAARPDLELDGDRIARLLADARVEDALGLRPLRGRRPRLESEFREAWSVGKFRVAYLLAEASRGIR